MARGTQISYGHRARSPLFRSEGPGQSIRVSSSVWSVLLCGSLLLSLSESRQVSAMLQEIHAEHTETISMFHHVGVTVFALRPHERCQHNFANSKLIAAACLPCSINLCFYFDHDPEMPPHLEGMWANVDVQHSFSLDYPQCMQRIPGEKVFDWFERCRSSEQWQPSRTAWATDEKLQEFSKCQMVATRNQMLYLDGVHGVVNRGFCSADEALTKLAPFIPQLKRFHVVAKFKQETRFWAYCAIEQALDSAITCWLYATERWGIVPKPCFTAVWSVETVAVAIVYNPNHNSIMLSDSHPYNGDCGASVAYGMGSNIMEFLEHAFLTTFRTENLDWEGKRIRGKTFEQLIELVMSESMAERYETNEALLPLHKIFEMF